MIEFDLKEFPELVLAEEWVKGYNTVSIDVLGSDAPIVQELLAAAASESEAEINEDDVLLLKADNFGDPQQLYPPTICKKAADDDTVILKVGANEFPVSLKAGMFAIGNLDGFFAPSANTVKFEKDGEKREFRKCFVQLSGDDFNYDWLVSLRLNQSVGTDIAPVQKAIAKAKSIADLVPYLDAVGGGGGAIKPHELVKDGITLPATWRVETWDSFEGNYGTSYKLKLASGGWVWGKGMVMKQLDAGFADRNPLPWNLRINEIVQRKDGRWFTSNKLIPIKKELAGVAAGSAPAIDEIPF